MRGLKNKKVVVTGGASGIGQAVCLRLLEEGSVPIIFDLGEPSQPELRKNTYRVDVTSGEQIRGAIDKFTRRLGRIDGLATCAGVMQTKPFLDLKEREVSHVMDVNFLGTFLSVQICARAMLESGRGGSIVTIASTAGRKYRPLAAHYAASKAAVMNLTRSAALALAPHGIRVNCVVPGMIDTPMISRIVGERSRLLAKSKDEVRRAFERAVPLGARLGRPEEVASAVTFLLSEDASYVTGEALGVTGGVDYA